MPGSLTHAADDEMQDGRSCVAPAPYRWRMPSNEYEARADASSPHPQDWGRAVSVVLQGLAEQAEQDGRGEVADVLRGADVHLHIEPIEDGVCVTGVWRPDSAE